MVRHLFVLPVNGKINCKSTCIRCGYDLPRAAHDEVGSEVRHCHPSKVTCKPPAVIALFHRWLVVAKLALVQLVAQSRAYWCTPVSDALGCSVYQTGPDLIGVPRAVGSRGDCLLLKRRHNTVPTAIASAPNGSRPAKGGSGVLGVTIKQGYFDCLRYFNILSPSLPLDVQV